MTNQSKPGKARLNGLWKHFFFFKKKKLDRIDVVTNMPCAEQTQYWGKEKLDWCGRSCVEGVLGQIAKLLVFVRRCACPALFGPESTGRLWTGTGCRNGWARTAETGET